MIKAQTPCSPFLSLDSSRLQSKPSDKNYFQWWAPVIHILWLGEKHGWEPWCYSSLIRRELLLIRSLWSKRATADSPYSDNYGKHTTSFFGSSSKWFLWMNPPFLDLNALKIQTKKGRWFFLKKNFLRSWINLIFISCNHSFTDSILSSFPSLKCFYFIFLAK